jgi:uracil-DNA glycosylase
MDCNPWAYIKVINKSWIWKYSMPQTKKARTDRIVRAVTQRLESLQQSGVQMIAKIPKTVASGRSVKSPHPSPLPKVEGTLVDPRFPKVEGTSRIRTPADPREAALAEIAQRVAQCTRCAELVANRTQTVFGVGNPYAKLVFCGEAPGADEDRMGEPFVGRAGKLLTDIIEKGMKMQRKDVYILNILRCRPPNNRNPLPKEAANCREYLDGQLDIIKPEYICCLGAIAAQNLLDTNVSIGKLRGRVLDFQGIKVVCTYHPAYVLRNPAAKKDVWEDIKLLIAEMQREG